MRKRSIKEDAKESGFYFGNNKLKTFTLDQEKYARFSINESWLPLIRGQPGCNSRFLRSPTTTIKDTLKQSTADPENIPKGYTQAASSKVQTAPNCASHSDEIICSFFAQQASMPTTHDDEDLLQIDEDAMEEIDIRWQVAMITARIRKFMRKTGRPIDLKPKNGITFDKSKIECFNCQKLGHFARECRFAKYQENRANGRKEKKIVAIEDSNSKALVATDNNEEIDWTKEFDAEPVTFAMMALTELEEDDWSMEIDAEPVHFGQDGLGDFDWSNKADDTPVSLALMATNSEVPYCSKCSKSYKKLLESYQTERDNFQKARSEILGYQMSLESLEVILKTHEKNEYAWGDKYEQMEYDLKIRDLKLEEKQKELDQVLKERDDFKDLGLNLVVVRKVTIHLGIQIRLNLWIDELAIRNKVVNQENTKSSQPEIDRNKVIIEDWVDSDDEETNRSTIFDSFYSVPKSLYLFESDIETARQPCASLRVTARAAHTIEDTQKYDISTLSMNDRTVRSATLTSSTKQKSSIQSKKQSTTKSKNCLLPILNINYFHHFLDILRNYNPMDDEPMWAADHVVTPTPGSAITIPKTANEFAIKVNYPKVLNAASVVFPLKTPNQAFQLLEDKSLTQARQLKIKKSITLKKCAFTDEELQSNAKKTKPDLDEDDIPMSREEEAKFMQTYHKTRFYNDYRDRDLNRDNWRSSERSSYNRDNYRSNTDDKPYDLQKQFNDFMKSQQSTNAFVKETFMDLKTQLETVAKNHQASIQNLETKFDKLADKQSSRPSGSLPSNTQPNPKGHNSKAYQPSDDEDEEPKPQPKTQNPKPVKETLLPKPYKPKISYPQSLRKEKMEAQYGKFLDMIRAIRINLPLIDVLARMPNYGKFLKELISNKHKIKQIFAAFLSDKSSAMIQNKVPPKLVDLGSFLIPCNFNKTFSCNALADLGTSINLMPYALYAKLSLETLKPTKMSVRLAKRSFQYLVGIAKNMLVEVGKFTFPADFVILEMEEDSKVPLILGQPFLHTTDAVIQVK
ncbi:reverse transcriptase domain-containing protein [Tanacetum coccineum]